MSRIGFIGTGHIAAPIARHLSRKGHDIIVTRRSEAVSAQLAQEINAQIADPQDVLERSDIVVLCLRPHLAVEVLSALQFRPGQHCVSVMAGVPRETLQQICAPAQDIVQTIPLGFVEGGGCPLPGYGNHHLLADLFAPENPVIAVENEQALNAHFAICAMVPGLLDLMATGADWLGERTGDADGAAFYTAQLMAGFLAAMDKDRAGNLGRERDALATAGTLSLQMTQGLAKGGAHAALREALNAIGKRLEP